MYSLAAAASCSTPASLALTAAKRLPHQLPNSLPFEDLAEELPVWEMGRWVLGVRCSVFGRVRSHILRRDDHLSTAAAALRPMSTNQSAVLIASRLCSIPSFPEPQKGSSSTNIVMRSLAAGLCSILLIGCSQKDAAVGSSPVHDGKPITLRLKAKVGDTYRYKLASTIEAIQGKDKLEWTIFWDEKATKADAKSSTWKVRFHDVKIVDTQNSQQAKERQQALEGLEASLTFDHLGRGVGVEEGDSGATGDLTFPEEAVKPGDTWEGEFTGTGKPMKVTFTYMKRLTEAGKPAVLIEGVLHKGQMASSVKPTQFVVDLATGKIVRASAEFELGQPPKMKMFYEITQVNQGH
jgi:hypothetical protein